jgi:hypothetical protein
MWSGKNTFAAFILSSAGNDRGLHLGSTVALPASTGDDPGYDIPGRAPINADRAPLDADRALEDDDGATVDPGRAPEKPGSFQKKHDDLRWLHLYVLKPFPIFILSSFA